MQGRFWCIFMQVNNQISNYPQNCTDKKAATFCGLTKFMQKAVYALPYEQAQRLLENYNKPYIIAGYFPKDILRILKRNASSSQDLGSRIRMFNSSFSDLAKKLRAYDSEVFKQIDKINFDDYAYEAIKLSAEGKLHFGGPRIPLKFSLNPLEKEALFADGSFEKIMKKIGLLADNGKVEIKFVGEGTYKSCFKVDFLDESGKKIVHSKAFIVGKNPNIREDCNDIFTKKLKEYLANQGYDKFFEKMKSRIEADATLSDDVKKKALAEIKQFFDEKYKKMYIHDGIIIMREFQDVNGIFPEANAALKIRKDLGRNYEKSNMITPHYFDLKNQYGIMEFADSELPKADFAYNFKKHNLFWGDIRESNYAYASGDRKIIDYGCIYPETKKDKYFQYD